MPDTLPNSLAKEAKREVYMNHMNWVPIFCANCGADGGFIPEDAPPFAFYLCNPCWETHGAIAGTMAVPDEIFWKEIAEEQKEKLNVRL